MCNAYDIFYRKVLPIRNFTRLAQPLVKHRIFQLHAAETFFSFFRHRKTAAKIAAVQDKKPNIHDR